MATAFYPPWHPFWDAVMDGYAAGLAHGIEIGRAQIEAEEHPIWQQIIDNVNRGAAALARRPGPIGHTERQAWLRQRAEDRAQHPGWTMQQIREHAYQSWGLTYPPTAQQPGQRQVTGRPRTGPGSGPARRTPAGRRLGGRRWGRGVGVAGREPSAEVRPPLGAAPVPGIPEGDPQPERHRPGHGTTPPRRPATTTPEKARPTAPIPLTHQAKHDRINLGGRARQDPPALPDTTPEGHHPCWTSASTATK